MENTNGRSDMTGGPIWVKFAIYDHDGMPDAWKPSNVKFGGKFFLPVFSARKPISAKIAKGSSSALGGPIGAKFDICALGGTPDTGKT